MTATTDRALTLAALIQKAERDAALTIQKQKNTHANLGMTPSLALAAQLAKLIDGDPK